MYQSLPARDANRTSTTALFALGAGCFAVGALAIAISPPAQMLAATVVSVTTMAHLAIALVVAGRLQPLSQRHAQGWMLIAASAVLRLLASLVDATQDHSGIASLSTADLLRFASGIPLGFAMSRLGHDQLDGLTRLRALVESIIAALAVASVFLAFDAGWIALLSNEEPLKVAALIGRPGAGAMLLWSGMLAIFRERDSRYRRAIVLCLLAYMAVSVTWLARAENALGLESVMMVLSTAVFLLAARRSLSAVAQTASDVRSRYWQEAELSRFSRLVPQIGMYISMAVIALSAVYVSYGYDHAPHFSERGLTICMGGALLLSIWVHANEAYQARRSRGQLRQVLGATNRLVDANTPREAIPHAVRELQQIISCRTISVYLLRKDGGYIRLKFEGASDQPVESFVASLAAPLADALNGDRPVFGSREMHSAELLMPIRTGHGSLGLLVMTAEHGKVFTLGQAELVEALCTQLALSIDSFRLRRAAADTAITDERNRLARELHDSVSQALFSIALGSKTAREQIVRKQNATDTLDYVVSLSETALAEMRALVFELRPESMMQFGLLSALRSQLESLCERNQLAARFEIRCDEPENAGTALKEATYRICMEAANNAIKHAQANALTLRVDVVDGHLAVDLSDNGRGFDSGGTFPGHLGLISMRERAQRLGGSLEITSAVGSGTSVRMRLPLAGSSNEVLG